MKCVIFCILAVCCVLGQEPSPEAQSELDLSDGISMDCVNGTECEDREMIHDRNMCCPSGFHYFPEIKPRCKCIKAGKSWEEALDKVDEARKVWEKAPSPEAKKTWGEALDEMLSALGVWETEECKTRAERERGLYDGIYKVCVNGTECEDREIINDRNMCCPSGFHHDPSYTPCTCDKGKSWEEALDKVDEARKAWEKAPSFEAKFAWLDALKEMQDAPGVWETEERKTRAERERGLYDGIYKVCFNGTECKDREMINDMCCPSGFHHNPAYTPCTCAEGKSWEEALDKVDEARKVWEKAPSPEAKKAWGEALKEMQDALGVWETDEQMTTVLRERGLYDEILKDCVTDCAGRHMIKDLDMCCPSGYYYDTSYTLCTCIKDY